MAVTGHGRLSIADAIQLHLKDVHKEAGPDLKMLADLELSITEVVAWITWQEIADIVNKQAATFAARPTSAKQCIQRLAIAVDRAVTRHS